MKEPCEETIISSQEDQESEGSSIEAGSSSNVNEWDRNLAEIFKLGKQQPLHSLKGRQLELIGATVRQFREDCRNRAELAQAQF